MTVWLNIKLLWRPRLVSRVVRRRRTSRVEAPRHYPLRVLIDGQGRYVAWYTADRDGFARKPDGRLVVADTPEALGVPLADAEPVVYDFDRIRGWCADPDAAGVNCPAFLNAWNFFDDLTGLHVGADTPYTLLSRAAAGCYDKLFWGNNLPAVTPPGERFEPSWLPEEIAAVRGVFEAGLCILAAELAGSAQDAAQELP